MQREHDASGKRNRKIIPGVGRKICIAEEDDWNGWRGAAQKICLLLVQWTFCAFANASNASGQEWVGLQWQQKCIHGLKGNGFFQIPCNFSSGLCCKAGRINARRQVEKMFCAFCSSHSDCNFWCVRFLFFNARTCIKFARMEFVWFTALMVLYQSGTRSPLSRVKSNYF